MAARIAVHFRVLLRSEHFFRLTFHMILFSPCSLGFSVTIFCVEALIAIAILLIRRNPAVGGELGGPKAVKTLTSSIFVCLWITYVAVSAMEAYGVINPGF